LLFSFLYPAELELKRDQCQNSCRATLPTKGYSISGPKISASLSFSAVSAFFNIREGDEASLNVTRGQDEYQKEEYQHANNELNGDNGIENWKSKPQRLPPLIEDLVGALDSDYVSVNDLKHRKRGQSRIIRRFVKQDENRQADVSKQGRHDFSDGDSSVAMVAAAAAAAVFSKNVAKQGNSRMVTINSEWEGALRWISSWGEHQKDTKGSDHDSHFPTPNKGKNWKQQRRKRDPNSNQWPQLQRFRAENEIDFELFLDVCIERCIGNGGEDRENLGQDGDASVDKIRKKSGIGPLLGVNHLLSSLMSIILFYLVSTKSLLLSQNFQNMFRSTMGIVLSTAIIWFIRHLNDWRKINKYTNSLRSLLEEEKREASSNNDAHPKIRNSSTKKSKKGRRKRRDIRVQQKEIKANERVMIEANESEASDDSFEQQTVEEEYKGKSYGSTECNTVTSTSTNDGACAFEYQLMSTNATILKHKATRDVKSSQKKNVYKKCNGTDFKKTRTRAGKKKFSVEKSKKPTINNRQEIHSKQRSATEMGNCNIPMIPTAEQREEAARKLRQFQQAQIQKIIDSKKRHSIASSTGQMTYNTKKVAVQNPSQAPLIGTVDAKSVDAKTVDAKTVELKSELIRPPPGLTKVDHGQEHMVDQEQELVTKNHDSVQRADESYLLSLLDEEEDEPRGKTASSPYRNFRSHHGHARSIALGDLLAGTYAGSSNAMNYASNPWSKDESIGGSTTTAETVISSPSRTHTYNSTSLPGARDETHFSNDANMRLQVSAVAFLPSETSNEDRIW
jgi:hypothetical protein